MSHRHSTAEGAPVYDISRARLIQALKTLHAAYEVYDECDHDHAVNDPNAIDIEDVGLTCAEALVGVICTHCCVRPYAGQTEECATEHKHLPGRSLCPTMALVDGRESPWFS